MAVKIGTMYEIDTGTGKMTKSKAFDIVIGEWDLTVPTIAFRYGDGTQEWFCDFNDEWEDVKEIIDHIAGLLKKWCDLYHERHELNFDPFYREFRFVDGINQVMARFKETQGIKWEKANG